jgi:protein phosphatase 1 regulatory subunit 37
LKYIDLSDTVWDRKGVEYLVQALNWTVVTPSSASMSTSTSGAAPEPDLKPEESEEPESETKEEKVEERKASYGSFGRYAPYLKEAEGSDAPSAVQTLRMDGCNLRAFVLEALGQFAHLLQDETDF